MKVDKAGKKVRRALAKVKSLAAIMVPLAALSACGADGTASPRTPIVPQSTAVGTPTGPTSSQVIGPNGGSVTSSDGSLTVTIPAGALSANTPVSVEPITALAPWALGPAYRLGPAGSTFTTPVSIAFHYDPAQLTGSAAELLWVVSQDTSGAWPYATAVTADTMAHTITVASSHFSDWSLIEGIQLRPPSAEVATKGTVALDVRNCFGGAVGYDCGSSNPSAPASGDDELPELPSAFAGLDAGSWSVNGVPGGSATYGHVAGTTHGAVYTAPTDAPDNNNPVAVTVRVLDHNGHSLTTLVSSIKILGTEHSYHAVGSLTRKNQQIAQYIFADVTDNLEFDFVGHKDGSIDISGLSNPLSTFTNETVVPPDSTSFCAHTLDSPYEFGTFDKFSGGQTPNGFLLEFSGTTTQAASSYSQFRMGSDCEVDSQWPSVDSDTDVTLLDIDATLFPNVGSDVVVLGTTNDHITSTGWVFDIRRTQ